VSDEELWLFGYGSLIWRPSFAFESRRTGHVFGWTRRFWQGSTDHRGVPDAPGRVVTLVAEAGARCRGAAYLISHGVRQNVIEELDRREQGGYLRHELELFLDGEARPRRALVYVAREDNPEYLGPASLPEIARQVGGARGPSGSNREYVLELARALRELGADDPHVFELEALLGGA
jgi:glutathione-specific gamma-glutamylcyclotransferase